MRIHSSYLLILLLSCVFGASGNAVPVKISESKLVQLAQDSSYGLDQIKAAALGVELQLNQANETFAPEVYGGASYLETKERALIQFQPIFSPIKQAKIGVKKNLTHGMQADAFVSTDQRSANSQFLGKIKNGSTSTLSFTLQMDLWKDLLGRASKATLENSRLEAKRAEIQRNINTKTYHLTLRRLYWSWVANEESLRVSRELIKTAQTQASESRKRLRNAVAESDEVARYDALVSQRRGSILQLEYQRQSLLKQLRLLLPQSVGELVLDKYDMSKTMNEVMACTATIAAQRDVPYDFTTYDELVGLINEVRSNTNTLNARYSDVDVKLYGNVKATGVSLDQKGPTDYRGTYSGTFDDMQDNNRSGFEVGLKFSVPLGDAKKTSKATKEVYDELRLKASVDQNQAQVNSTHEQLAKSIGLLIEVVKAQRLNSEQLSTRLRGMRRKYEQARISVDDLINDQNSLLSSELVTIDVQLEMLNTLFDYLAVFTETPCEFNRKI